ncbi:hypothetical protein Gotur_023417, partial [Gossypium turneri]
MELIIEVPPITVEGRIVACEGDNNPALGHPIEFICLDLKEPAVCKHWVSESSFHVALEHVVSDKELQSAR